MLTSFTSLFAALAVLVSIAHTFPFFSEASVTRSVCEKPLPANQTTGGGHTHVAIESSGVNRSYLITIPSSYTSQASTPVIFSFHGGMKSALEQLHLSQMSNSDFNPSAIAVYPQGLERKRDNSSTRSWEGFPGVTANDTQFVTDIIDQLETLYCIDYKRIWATGKSDGGGFCNVLACHPVLSLKIAAFAPVSGAFYINETGSACKQHLNDIPIPCNNSRNIPMFEFHGGALDKTIPYDGKEKLKECLPSIPHFIQAWAARDGLSEKNVTKPVSNDTVKYIYGTGDEKGLVQHVFDKNIGHVWPSTMTNDDNNGTVSTFNASTLIVEWFNLHHLP